ncbi:MAG: hypothetical protein H6767_09745 [Candidatus Peribacteria bacterium]|nr:MAG: hypothetical protein H6767_09745 [Candidatus Peribacteria bacterium]
MLGKIVVIGDVMLDKYSYGDVKRLNPEGPNPLLHIHHEEYRLGGAANVAANIASLADSCDLIGMVGEDANTEIFMTACEEANIHLIPVLSSSPTITKWRFIENTYHQQMLRVDYEERVDIIGYQIEKISEALEQVSYEYIVISDYNKGMITPDLVHMLQTYAREK